MNTVRKLSKSVPRPLSLVLGSTCRNFHAVVLPRLPYAHYANAFVLSRRPLRWGLRVRLPFTPLPAVRCRPPLRTPWVDASEMSSSRRRTSAAPIPASWPATATVPSPRHTPTSSKYEKREALPPPFRGYQTATLPTRARRFRAWTIPTPVQPPSQASRRSARTEYARPRPEPRHHRDGEPEFPSASGHRQGCFPRRLPPPHE